MNIIKLTTLLMVVILLVACTAPVTGKPENAGQTQSGFQLAEVAYEPLSKDMVSDDTKAQAVASAVNHFSDALLAALSPQESFVISPFSVYMALAAVVDGAEGETLNQLNDALLLNDLSPDMSKEEALEACRDLMALLTGDTEKAQQDTQYGVSPEETLKLEIATLLCVDRDYTLNLDYAQTLKNYFGADIASADFQDPALLEFINNWANEKTHGLVPNLISEIKPQDVLLLANSIYFSGKWQGKFDPELTQEKTFYAPNGQTNVLMMHRETTMSYVQNDWGQAVRLPYYGGAYMDLYLPAEGVTPLEALQKMSALSGADFTSTMGTLEVPRFTVETQQPLESALQAMGLEGIFAGGLTGIAQQQELAVNELFQKAKIEVDEE